MRRRCSTCHETYYTASCYHRRSCSSAIVGISRQAVGTRHGRPTSHGTAAALRARGARALLLGGHRRRGLRLGERFTLRLLQGGGAVGLAPGRQLCHRDARQLSEAPRVGRAWHGGAGASTRGRLAPPSGRARCYAGAREEGAGGRDRTSECGARWRRQREEPQLGHASSSRRKRLVLCRPGRQAAAHSAWQASALKSRSICSVSADGEVRGISSSALQQQRREAPRRAAHGERRWRAKRYENR